MQVFIISSRSNAVDRGEMLRSLYLFSPSFVLLSSHITFCISELSLYYLFFLALFFFCKVEAYNQQTLPLFRFQFFSCVGDSYRHCSIYFFFKKRQNPYLLVIRISISLKNTNTAKSLPPRIPNFPIFFHPNLFCQTFLFSPKKKPPSQKTMSPPP